MCKTNCAKCDIVKTPENTGVNKSGQYVGKFRAYCKNCYIEMEAAKRRRLGIKKREAVCSCCGIPKTDKNTERLPASGELKPKCIKCVEAFNQMRLNRRKYCNKCGIEKTLENTVVINNKFIHCCKNCNNIIKRERRAADEALRSKERQYAQERNVKIQSDPKASQLHRQKCRIRYEATRTCFKERVRRLLSSCRCRANRTGMEFNLTVDFIIGLFEKQQYKCLLTSINFSLDPPADDRWKNPYTPSIDRIDSNLGYTKDNVRLILTCVNLALNEWGDGVLNNWVSAYFKVLTTGEKGV